MLFLHNNQQILDTDSLWADFQRTTTEWRTPWSGSRHDIYLSCLFLNYVHFRAKDSLGCVFLTKGRHLATNFTRKSKYAGSYKLWIQIKRRGSVKQNWFIKILSRYSICTSPWSVVNYNACVCKSYPLSICQFKFQLNIFMCLQSRFYFHFHRWYLNLHTPQTKVK